MQPIPSKDEMARAITAYMKANKLKIAYVSRKTGLKYMCVHHVTSGEGGYKSTIKVYNAIATGAI